MKHRWLDIDPYCPVCNPKPDPKVERDEFREQELVHEIQRQEREIEQMRAFVEAEPWLYLTNHGGG